MQSGIFSYSLTEQTKTDTMGTAGDSGQPGLVCFPVGAKAHLGVTGKYKHTGYNDDQGH